MLSKIITENESELIEKLSELIEDIANTSIQERNTFNIAVSGGSLVKFLVNGLPKVRTDFKKWKVFFCDERVVDINDPESTFGIYKKELIHKLDLTEEQFVKIKNGVSAEEAAEDYSNKLAQIFGDSLPRFDLLLLGMGPDGHTCSLFPGHLLLNESKLWVAPIMDSPKPPPNRITLTFPVINNAKNCIFAMAGDEKAEMVKRILKDGEDLPATRVKPNTGNLYWILDKNAAKFLNETN